MAIENVYEPDRYTGDGTQTVFPVSFAFHDTGWLRVTLTTAGVDTDLVNETDFTGAIAPGGVGGSVTLAIAPASGVTVTVWMDVPRTQPAVLPGTGHFDLKGLERMLDRATLQIQQVAENVGRAVKTSVASTTPPDQIMAGINAAAGAAQAAASAAGVSETAAASSAAGAENSAQAAAGSEAVAADAVADGLAAMEALRQATIAAVAGASVPVGAEFMWFADPADPTGDIPAGYVLGMGGELSRATYPSLWAFAEGTGRVVSEAAWQAAYAANSGNVGFYSAGDGATTFRVPRIVRYVSGGEIAESGQYLGDAIRNITGSCGQIRLAGAGQVPTGAFKGTSTGVTLSGTGSGTAGSLDSFDASAVVPTAGENRPKTIRRTAIIKAFSAAVNMGEVDMEHLASDVAALQAGYAGRVVRRRAYAEGGVFTTTTSLAAGASPTPSSGVPLLTKTFSNEAVRDLFFEVLVPWAHADSGAVRAIIVAVVLDGVVVGYAADTIYGSGVNTTTGAYVSCTVPNVPAVEHTVAVRFMSGATGTTITVNPQNTVAGLKATLSITEVQV